MNVPLGVAEPPREPGDALAVDDAVGDQPHRAPDEVAAPVPLRRAGRRVGAAALARAEPGRLRSRGGAVEADVLALRRPRGAARPAVDPGRGDGAVDPAVEARVGRLDGLPEPVGIDDHRSTLPRRTAAALAEIGRDLGRRSPTMRRHSGRLAQLGEHLVYTQGVGGSSPSPPIFGESGPSWSVGHSQQASKAPWSRPPRVRPRCHDHGRPGRSDGARAGEARGHPGGLDEGRRTHCPRGRHGARRRRAGLVRAVGPACSAHPVRDPAREGCAARPGERQGRREGRDRELDRSPAEGARAPAAPPGRLEPPAGPDEGQRRIRPPLDREPGQGATRPRHGPEPQGGCPESARRAGARATRSPESPDRRP